MGGKEAIGELKIEGLLDAENPATIFYSEYQALQSKKTNSEQGKLLALNLFLSNGGIIRSNSQLNHAEYLSFDAFNHAIYPVGDWVTKLTVSFYHIKRMNI